MILSFGDKETKSFGVAERPRRYGNIARVALRKLLQLHAAEKFSDISVPPGTQLEALSANVQSASTTSGVSVSFELRRGSEKVTICDLSLKRPA